jgi:hypothetical protein
LVDQLEINVTNLLTFSLRCGFRPGGERSLADLARSFDEDRFARLSDETLDRFIGVPAGVEARIELEAAGFGAGIGGR